MLDPLADAASATMDSLYALTTQSLAPVSLARSAAFCTATAAVGEQSVPTTMVRYMVSPQEFVSSPDPIPMTLAACALSVRQSLPERALAVCPFAHLAPERVSAAMAASDDFIPLG